VVLEATYRHKDTANTDPRTQPLAYARRFPQHAREANGRSMFIFREGGLAETKDKRTPGGGETERNIPVLIPVYESGHHGVGVGAGADEEQDDEEERLEVEDCRLLGSGKEKGWLV
jgi:hypothetical protein